MYPNLQLFFPNIKHIFFRFALLFDFIPFRYTLDSLSVNRIAVCLIITVQEFSVTDSRYYYNKYHYSEQSRPDIYKISQHLCVKFQSENGSVSSFRCGGLLHFRFYAQHICRKFFRIEFYRSSVGLNFRSVYKLNGSVVG